MAVRILNSAKPLEGILVKFRELRKRLEKFGIMWDAKVGKGSHGAFVGLSKRTRIRRVYPLPADQQRDVSNKYLKPLRRQFELTPEDGVSDEAFFENR